MQLLRREVTTIKVVSTNRGVVNDEEVVGCVTKARRLYTQRGFLTATIACCCDARCYLR